MTVLGGDPGDEPAMLDVDGQAPEWRLHPALPRMRQ
jgi:hypothetical protein